MTENEIKEIIVLAINDYFELKEIKEKATGETVLFGSDSIVDSLGFVNIIVDVENRLKEKNFEISLTSEKAMSRRNSPFKSVTALTEFIKEEIGQ
jgi:acyl carrier protein